MSGLNLDRIVFDSAITQPNIGAVLLDSDGDKLTSTLISGKQSLDVNIANASVVVSATDLDIRDLSHTQDSVKVGDGTDFLAINTDGSIGVRLSDGTDSLNINADGSINAVVSATDLDIRDLSHTQDSVKVGDGTDFLAVNADGSINVNLTDDGIADDAADSGNPFKVGGKAYSSLAADPVDNGDRANLAQDLYRRVYMNGSAHMAVKNTAESITTTASEVAATPLAGRVKITLQNKGSNSVYIGMNSSVTSSNGLEIPKNSSYTEDLAENVELWAISASGTNDLRVFEAA